MNIDELLAEEEAKQKERYAKAERLLLDIPLTQARLCAKILTIAAEDFDFDNNFSKSYIKTAQLVRLLYNVKNEEVKIVTGKGDARQTLLFPAEDLMNYILYSSTLGDDIKKACNPFGEIDEEGNEILHEERDFDEVLEGFWEEFELDEMINSQKALKSDKNTWIPKAGMIAEALDEILQQTEGCFRNQTERRSFIYNLMGVGLKADFYKRRMITEWQIDKSHENAEYETWDSLQARCISQAIEAYRKNKNKVDWICRSVKLYDMIDYDSIIARSNFPNLWEE